LGNPSSWNRYAYANGDPVNLRDPHGKIACDTDEDDDCDPDQDQDQDGGGGGGPDGVIIGATLTPLCQPGYQWDATQNDCDLTLSGFAQAVLGQVYDSTIVPVNVLAGATLAAPAFAAGAAGLLALGTGAAVTAGTVGVAAAESPEGQQLADDAMRGMNQNLGGIFSSQATEAGGTLYTSQGLISQGQVGTIVNTTVNYVGGAINIITGAHGAVDGTLDPDPSMLQEDISTFGSIPGVTIYNVMTTGSSILTQLVNGPGTTIGAFCNSAAYLSPFMHC
jgi:hypothetical protein